MPPKVSGEHPGTSPFPSRDAARLSPGQYARLNLVEGAPGFGDSSHEASVGESLENEQELELLALVEKSRQDGFEKGLEEGRVAAFAELQDRMNRWKSLVEELTTLRGTMIEAYRNELLELAFCMTESILSRDLGEDRMLIKSLVGTSLEALPHKESIQITLGPDDADALKDWLDQLSNNNGNISLKTDPKLESGDLLVRGESGSIECILKDRIEQVRALVRGCTEELAA